MTKKIKNQKSKIKYTNQILNRLRNNRSKIVFFVIIVLAFFLRFYDLSNVPPSASLDEVSIGYNAYSIFKTGADEYGNKFPLLLRAYDDFRPALYVYLVAPFVQIFGLNVLAVRLPSVILSVLTVLVTYFLVKELFKNSKSEILNPKQTQNSNNQNSKNPLEIRNWKLEVPIIATAMLAISPWHIYIGRLGHEANAGFAFGLFAILFFLKFTNNFGDIYLYLSSVLFGLSFYSYQSEKIFVPLIVIALSFIFAHKLMQRKKQVSLALFFGLIIAIPVLLATLSPNGLIRFKATSAFNINDPLYTNAAKERLIAKKNGDVLKEIMNNNRFISMRIFLGNYLSHFNPYWLFTSNEDEDFKVPKVGLMHKWEFPFISLGIIYLFFTKKISRKIKLLIVTWILISPIAASITTGSPHAMRVYNLLPVPQILAALGLLQTAFFLKNALNNKYYVFLYKAIIFVFFLIVLASVTYFYKQYFYIFPNVQSSSFQYTLSQAISFVLKQEERYNKIVFSNKDNLYQSYMFFLFYSKYDPHLYQKQGGTESGGFAETHTFDKYEFRSIVVNEEGVKNSLYVVNANENVNNGKFLRSFKDLDGKYKINVFDL